MEPLAAAQNPPKTVSLDEVREQIELKLTEDLANRQMETWLENARRRSQIVFHPEAFE